MTYYDDLTPVLTKEFRRGELAALLEEFGL